MKQLIENYKKLEQYCKQKQNELLRVPDLYDETNADHLSDKEFQLLINIMNQKYQQYHPLKIKEKLMFEFIENFKNQGVNREILDLQQYQLNCQQTLQYLLSILNFILKMDENQKLRFYSNPSIKIKCHTKESKFYKRKLYELDLKQLQSYLNEFIDYLLIPIIFDSLAIQIILILKEFTQPSLDQFKNNIRKLYTQLILYLDFEQYLQEELLYEIKENTSPFFYKLNKCNYNICFNDNYIKDPNGQGFLPVLQKIKGYKGYGNLFMINARQNEWQNVNIYKCQYEILLIYKQLSKASFHLFQEKMQFRYISNHQIIKYYQSYRILYHNLEKSPHNNYVDHFKQFIYLYEQFLQDNQLDTTIQKQFKQLIDQKSNQINQFLEDQKQQVEQIIKEMKLQKSLTQQEIEESNKKIVWKSITQLQSDIQKIVQNIPESIKEWINNIYMDNLLKKIIISSNEFDNLKNYLIRQIQDEKIEQIFQQLDYFNEQHFSLKQLTKGSQSMIYYCEHIITKRQFALGKPFQNYDYSQLKDSIEKIYRKIPKQQRKGICKILKIDSNHMWMEYAIFGNLEEYMYKIDLKLLEKILICQQISYIIQKLHHSQLYHLDLKLQNFIVFKKYGINRIKLCDFGSMTDQKEFQFNINQHRMLYSPNEVKKSSNVQSDKFDLWQLGNVFKQILGKVQKSIQISDFFQNLLHNNPHLRPDIDLVVIQIEQYIQNNLDLFYQNSFIDEMFQLYYNQYLEEQQQSYKKQQENLLDQKIQFHKIQYIRKADKQPFHLEFLNKKWRKSSKSLIFYDIIPTINNWSWVCLLRNEKQFQRFLNKQYWSIQTKILFVIGLLKQCTQINSFKFNNFINYETQLEFRDYIDDLDKQLQQDNYDQEKENDIIEKNFIIMILIFDSLVIDLLQQSFKYNLTMLELKEIVKKIIYKQNSISNKFGYLGNIESSIYKVFNLNQQLKFISKNIIKINGFLYIIEENNKKNYFQITKEIAKQGSDQALLEIILQNGESEIINFRKFEYQNYSIYKLDLKNNLQAYIKFVVQQIILNYQGKNIIDSPYNLIEGVFIDKRYNKFIKNNLYTSIRANDENVNFLRYLTQILYSQLVAIGSMTFNQKIQERYKQLNDYSYCNDDQNMQQFEMIFIQLIQAIFQLRKVLGIPKQLDLLYFIQDHWNSDLINLVLLCKNLKDNINYMVKNSIGQTQQYIVLNYHSNFQYYISIENIQNASQLYKAFISSQLLEVIIYQQKSSRIIEGNQNRILIDQFQSVSLSNLQKNPNFTKQKNQEILNYNIYLKIQQKQEYEIYDQFKVYSLFDWVSLIKCLLNKFDVYCNYQYFKIQYGNDLIIKLLILIRCCDLFQDQYIKEIQDMILIFKQKNEYYNLIKIIDLLQEIYNNKIVIISQNLLELRIQIFKLKYNNFGFFNFSIQAQKQSNKQLNVIAYLAYFILVNQQYYESLYYDLDEEQIYSNQRVNTFHIKYYLFFENKETEKIFQKKEIEKIIIKNLQYQYIISLLKNFKFQIKQTQEHQINYVMDQYNFETRLEQQEFQIIQRLNYVNPQRIYVIKNKYNPDQQYLCCYHFGSEFLNYNDYKVIKNQNPLDYHCQSIVKLHGQIIRIKQLSKSNIDQMIQNMKNITELLYNQGFEYEILESNIVIVLNQLDVLVYPVTIKKVQNQLNQIINKINQYQQNIVSKLNNVEQIKQNPQN